MRISSLILHLNEAFKNYGNIDLRTDSTETDINELNDLTEVHTACVIADKNIEPIFYISKY